MATTTMRSTRLLQRESCLISSTPVNYTCLAQLYQSRRQSTKRRLHSTSQDKVAASLPLSSADGPITTSSPTSPASAPLSCLPLSQILRSYLITSASSSPALLSASTSVLRAMLESQNPVFNLSNPLLRSLLNETFYKQFCAGETSNQVALRCSELRAQGYSGVILEYALEVLKDAENANESEDIAIWRKGMLKSVEYAAEGDFLGLKWSGMGPAAMKRMAKVQDPSPQMSEAMHAVAKAARDKNIALLPAAEETWNLDGFQKWTIDMQREYNTTPGKSVVYTTYQMYLKDMPGRIAKHLEVAKAEGFTLGAKLVRGAYLGSEKRSLIWDTIEETHAAYDAAAEALIKREYTNFLKPTTASGSPALPDINVVVASHNADTVQKAQALRKGQAARGEELTTLVFAQLQGMADEVSCSLLAAAKAQEGDANAVKEKVFKCTTWGSMYECLNYLLRRAAENKDAAGRTWETRNAMQAELGRRMKKTCGLGA